MKKILASALAAVMALSLFGCKTSDDTDLSSEGTVPETTTAAVKKDPITLTWFNVGNDQQKDYNEVLKKINEKIQSYEGLEHVSVELITTGWSNVASKLSLLVSSGSAPDLFNPCAAGYVQQWVAKGACADLTDLVTQYCPEVYEELPEWLLDTQKVDGKLYAIPTYQQNNANYYGYFMPTELAEKYMDIKSLEALADSQAANYEEGLAIAKNRFDLLTDYLTNCYSNGQIRKGAQNHIGLGMTAYMYVGVKAPFQFTGAWSYDPLYGNNSDVQVVANPFLTLDGLKNAAQTGVLDQFSELANSYLYDWWEKGYIRQDVLSTQDADLMGKKDGLIIWQEQSVGSDDPDIRKTNEETASKKYGFDITIIPQGNTYKMSSDNASGGHCVYTDCKYKEEAVQLAALMVTEKGKDLLDLVVYGIEGTHYTKTGENTIKTPYSGNMAGSDDAYGQAAWAWGNIFNAYTNQATDPKMANFVKEMHKTAVESKLSGYNGDESKYDSELALIKALANESVLYDKNNGYGSDTYRNALKKYYQSLLDSGAEKIMVDFQKQADDFLANK